MNAHTNRHLGPELERVVRRRPPRPDSAARADAEGLLTHLQRTAGNTAVNALLRRYSVRGTDGPTGQLCDTTPSGPAAPAYTGRIERYQYSFAVTIPRVPAPEETAAERPARDLAVHDLVAAAASRSTGSDRDAMPGAEESPDPATATAGTDATPDVSSVAEPGVGESVKLPDIEVAALADATETDAVHSTLTYSPTVAQGGDTPDGFGVTRPFSILRMTNRTVTKTDTAYTASATIENSILFQVRATTGPDGQENVESTSSPLITGLNYTDVARDLMPDMADLGGRPPRDRYWARDLTLIHEHFHAEERRQHATQGVQLAQNQINAQSASSIADVNTLLGGVLNTVIATSNAAMTMPGKEQRAYADGAPLYQARAQAIKSTGDANGYPMPPGDYELPDSGDTALA